MDFFGTGSTTILFIVVAALCLLALASTIIFFRLRSALSERDVALTRAHELATELAVLQERVARTKEQVETHKTQVAKLQDAARLEFENLANRIFQEKTEVFASSSRQQLSDLLEPVRTRLRDFEEKVVKVYGDESRERLTLKVELEKMIEANQKIGADAANLTRALKGDSKLQGHWGEMQLELILEKSGLREGDEYIREGKTLKLKSSEGKHLRPDVIINLPDEKHVIIDAKVSLLSYERFANEEDESRRSVLRKDFIKSIKQHIDSLSDKHYDQASALTTPDFVLMFCPIEPAFSVIVEQSRDILTYAWEKRIMLASPSTLLTGLRTVSSLWRTERQNRNALEIARQGGALYDKFAAFLKDLEKIGKNLNETRRGFDAALNKLSEGRGNLMSRAEKLRDLGAKTSKRVGATKSPQTQAPLFNEEHL